MKNQTDMEHDVFISYSRKDEELVKKIRAALTQANISYWIDKEEIKYIIISIFFFKILTFSYIDTLGKVF